MHANIDNPFWRNVGIVISGTSLAQLIPLLGSLLIARIYTPTEFGLLANWLGIAQLLAIVMTCRYEMALALVADGEPRRVGMIATLAVATIALILMALAITIAWITGFTKKMNPSLIFALLPGAAFLCLTQVWQAWAAAEGRYRDLGIIRIGQALAITSLQILAGTFIPEATTLVWAQVAGCFVGVALCAWRLPLNLAKTKMTDIKVFMLVFLRQNKRFPTLSLPADSINTAAALLPLLIIANRFGADLAGLLAMAMRTLGAPISLIGAAILDVFRRRVATSWRESGNCREDYLQTFCVLTLCSALAALALVLTVESLFAFVFGERWRAAGSVAYLMLPMFTFRFVASPLSYIFYVANKQHIDLIWQCSLLAITIITLTLTSSGHDAILAYSIGYSGLYLIYIFLSYRFSQGNHT